VAIGLRFLPQLVAVLLGSQLAQLKKLFPVRMNVVTIHLGETALCKN
jgi:hypothetical protein